MSREIRSCLLKDREITMTALQDQLGQFADEYNHRRPHRSLDRRTPAAAYAARPKAAPIPDGGRPTTRTGRVGSNGTITHSHDGRRHHIALGRRHAGATVQVTSTGPAIQIADAATGEVLRELTIDPTRDYQPTGAPPGRTRKNPTPEM